MDEKKLPNWLEFANDLIVRALKDESLRKELLADPKAVVEREMGKIKEGSKLPDALEIKVIEQPANALYLVLPTLPGKLSDEVLDAVLAGGPTLFLPDELSDEALDFVAGGVLHDDRGRPMCFCCQ